MMINGVLEGLKKIAVEGGGFEPFPCHCRESIHMEVFLDLDLYNAIDQELRVHNLALNTARQARRILIQLGCITQARDTAR